MAKQSSKKTSGRVGFWQMVRDVFVTSMNKGQFPMALVGAVILSLIFRMPSDDVSKLVFEVLYTFKSGAIVGWVLTMGLAVGWFLHSKHQRRMMHDEVARIAKQRDDCHEKMLGKLVTSSNRKIKQ